MGLPAHSATAAAWFGLHPVADGTPAPRKHPFRRQMPSPAAYLRAVRPS